MATKRKNTQSLKGINSIDKITGEFSTKDAATATSSSSALLLLLPCAVLTAALPGYIFSTAMFDMPLDANQVVFGAVTLVTVVMLVMAYINLADARYLAKSSELGINSTDKNVIMRSKDKGPKIWRISLGAFTTRDKAERHLLKATLTEIDTLKLAAQEITFNRTGWKASFIHLNKNTAEMACEKLIYQGYSCEAKGPDI